LALLGAGAAATGVAAAAAALAAARARRAEAAPSSPSRDAPPPPQQPWTARRATGTAALALAATLGLRGAWRAWRLLADPGDRALLLEHDCVVPPAASDDASSPTFDHRPLVAEDTAALLARCGASEDLADLASDGTLVAVDCAAYVRRLLREAEEAGATAAAASDAPWWKGPYRTLPPATVVPSTVVLVGTAHVSPKSARDASRAVERLCPHVVFVELCRERAPLLAREGAVAEGVLPVPLLLQQQDGDDDDIGVIREARDAARDLGLLGDDESETTSSGRDDEDDDEDDDDDDDDDGDSDEEGDEEAPQQQQKQQPQTTTTTTTTTQSLLTALRAASRSGSGLAALKGMMEALYARFERELGVKAGAEFVAARLAAEDLSREGAICSENPQLWERLVGVVARRRAAQFEKERAEEGRRKAGAPPPPPNQPLATRRALLNRLALCQPTVTLGDRPIRDTLRAMWAALSPTRRLALGSHLISALWSDAGALDVSLVESLKNDDALAALVAEFGRDFPELLAPLIHDRNYVLAANAWAAGASARARVAQADAHARHRERHERAAEEWRRQKVGEGEEEEDKEDDDQAERDQGRRGERRQEPTFRPLAPWQVQKLLSELDGGTRRDGDDDGDGAADVGGGDRDKNTTLAPSPPEVVAIVGKGHVGGMVYALRRMCEAFAERVIAQRCALEQVRRAQEQEAAAAAATAAVA
jgi:pheromone shutdown protein TraB